MNFNFSASSKYTEENFENLILKNPNNIDNYIMLSKLYEDNDKSIEKVLLPIFQAEYKAKNKKDLNKLLLRKIDIYAYYGDIDFEDMNNEAALDNFLKAWEFAKTYILKEKIEDICSYDLSAGNMYSLYDLLYNINYIYDEMSQDYFEDWLVFIKDVFSILNLDNKQAYPFLHGKQKALYIKYNQCIKF